MSKNNVCFGFHIHEEKNERGEWHLCSNSLQFVRLKGGVFASALLETGAVGALFGSLMQRAKITVNIPYSDILSVTLTNYKNEKQALCIKTKSTCIYAIVDDPETWLKAIQDQMHDSHPDNIHDQDQLIDTSLDNAHNQDQNTNAPKTAKEINMEQQAHILCPKCKQTVKSNLQFCPLCGCSLTKPSTPKCPNCGKVAPQGEKFCSSCGAAYINATKKGKPCTVTSEKSKKRIIILGISLVLIIATLLLVFLVIVPAQKVTYTVNVYSYCQINNFKKYENHKATLTVEEGDILGDLSHYQEKTWGTGVVRAKFKGWYTDKEGTNPWNPYVDKVQSNMTIYAVYSRDE